MSDVLKVTLSYAEAICYAPCDVIDITLPGSAPVTPLNVTFDGQVTDEMIERGFELLWGMENAYEGTVMSRDLVRAVIAAVFSADQPTSEVVHHPV